MAPLLALLLLAFGVGTAMGNSEGRLSDPSVSPTMAIVGTTVSFGVTFTDPEGDAPRSVSVAFDRDLKPMTGAGCEYSHGVRFTATATPGVGHHEIWFRSTDADGRLDYARGGDLTIGPAPLATPTRTDSPTPTPTRAPASTPTRTPSPAATRAPEPTPSRASGTTTSAPSRTMAGHASSPPAGSTSTKAAGPGTSIGPAGGSPSGGLLRGLGGWPAGSKPSAGSSSATDDPSDSTTDISAGAVLSGPAGYELTYGASRGGTASGVPAALFTSRNLPLPEVVAKLAPTVATACAGTVAWAAFAFLGRRRRDDDETDDGLLAAAAASGLETGAAGGLEVDESLLPRWRRPSLQQVRRTDPLRAAAETPHLSFESAGVRPLEDYETRRIGYRLVRLLDSPDELRSTEIGILDQGDEVQLLERHGVYWLVLCPDGRQGWVHRMTLADPARADAAEPAPESGSQEGAVEYEMPDIESYAEEPSSDGLLEAYMTARRDVLRTMANGESGATAASGDGPTFVAFEAATFAVPAAEVEAQVEASPTPAPESVSASASAETPAAESERAGERYSARKTAGTRKAATASRPGTRSRRPSR